jgi:ABC-type transport system involved in multi-copper enzyme maturation permease subunit
VFVAHELATQIRSARFHGTTLAYLVLSIAPAVGAFLLGRRFESFVSSPEYGSLMDFIQPIATTAYGAAIAVDAIARERDENSLGVVAMAPISAAGYILYRWIALLTLLVPVTLIPRGVALGLIAQAERAVPDAAPILFGWLLYVAPVLVVVTALALALGTITNRVVLALIAGLGIFTVAFGITNDLLAYAHRQIDGAGDFFGVSDKSFLLWIMRGYISVDAPTAAGFPLEVELDRLVISGALATGIAALLLGLSCAYLRRTKRDIRPWRIREDHQLRSFLRTMNRLREEFSPDGGLEIPERIAIVIGLIVPIAAVMMIDRRYDAFAALAKEGAAAEARGVAEMPITIVPAAASLRGKISRGVLEGTAVLTLRNDGNVPQRVLAFRLNRGVGIERVSASRGTARLERAWDRVGVRLDPPLAPRESRSIEFALRGTPGSYQFNLRFAPTFAQSWERYVNAKQSIELSDLSRSNIRPLATSAGMLLGGADLLPVPRYTAWTPATDRMRRGAGAEPGFVPEAIRPETAISIDLDVPDTFTAIDACGSIATVRLASRCRFPLVDYIVIGTRYETMPVSQGVRLAYLPPHGELARTHAPSISGAIALAKEAWPTFTLHDRAVFLERPRVPGERYYDWNPTDGQTVNAVGAMNLLSEVMFTRLKALDREEIAAALISRNLLGRRPVARTEHRFFRGFYATIASWRTGGRRPTAVEPGTGDGKPMTDPIIHSGEGGWRGPIRLRRVLIDIEYRVGSDRLVAGIEDFLAGGPERGTAKELLDAIARRGGISLDRYYADYFKGDALPRLTFVDVVFARTDGGWEVRGQVKNEAGGEVFCPVVLRTAAGAVRTTLRVDAQSSTPFLLRSPHAPRTLQLDPEKVVYRHAAVGLIESVDYKEPS